MRKRGGNARKIATLVCWIVLIAGLIYIARWYATRARIERETREYQALYRSTSETPVPTQMPEPALYPSQTPEETPPQPTELPSVADHPRESATPAQTETPAASISPTAAETPVQTVQPYIDHLPTEPPIQESFTELLNRNPDTIGYLTVGDVVSLPVVWLENDNDTYLDHNFSGEIAPEGTLFLDGYNRLVPEDNCLIVYGHNMQNGTMFGSLHLFEKASTVRNCPLVSFDTIYANATYLPFAAVRISAETDFRKFLLDETEFSEFVEALRGQSSFSVPIDVSYGDSLLLLVTCDYDESDGRFILALRKLRETERAGDMAAQIRKAQSQS